MFYPLVITFCRIIVDSVMEMAVETKARISLKGTVTYQTYRSLALL